MSFLQQFSGINALYYQYSEYREKRKEYYKVRSDIKSYDHFLKRVNESVDANIKTFNAPIRIKPFGLNFGISKQEVVLELGKPDYVLVETGLRNHQIIYYKKKRSGYGHLLQIHFINNKMVYAMNRIRDISESRGTFFMKITRMLLVKYSISSHEDLNIIDVMICDEFNNKIVATETLGLSIRFISGSEDFIDFLKSRVEKKKTKTENVETTNLGNIFVHI